MLLGHDPSIWMSSKSFYWAHILGSHIEKLLGKFFLYHINFNLHPTSFKIFKIILYFGFENSKFKNQNLVLEKKIQDTKSKNTFCKRIYRIKKCVLLIKI